VSGRVGKDAAAAFLRPRFVVTIIVIVVVAAIAVWAIRGG
jgi:hypothetical protein